MNAMKARNQLDLFNEMVAFIRVGLTQGRWDKEAAFSLQADIIANIAHISYTLVILPKKVFVTEEVDGEIRAFLRNKEKIKAIKRLREATGLGLKEAKECIDEYATMIEGRP